MEEPPRRGYNVHSFTSFSDYLSLLENEKKNEEENGNQSDFIFRGQPIDKPLLPVLARNKPKGKLLAIEQLLLEEFKRTSLPFIEFSPKNDWQSLSIAQHHGLPTRFLDWTYSALAALWFAVRNPPVKDENNKIQDGVVWVLKSDKNDFLNITEIAESTETPFEIKRTRIYRPRLISKRIVAQAGLFTVHYTTDNTDDFVPLEDNKFFSKKLVKIRVSHKNFEPIRQRLNSCGINSSSMIPDLDGLCKHIAWRYIHPKLSP
jgi:FRG domain